MRNKKSNLHGNSRYIGKASKIFIYIPSLYRWNFSSPLLLSPMISNLSKLLMGHMWYCSKHSSLLQHPIDLCPETPLLIDEQSGVWDSFMDEGRIHYSDSRSRVSVRSSKEVLHERGTFGKHRLSRFLVPILWKKPCSFRIKCVAGEGERRERGVQREDFPKAGLFSPKTCIQFTHTQHPYPLPP